MWINLLFVSSELTLYELMNEQFLFNSVLCWVFGEGWSCHGCMYIVNKPWVFGLLQDKLSTLMTCNVLSIASVTYSPDNPSSLQLSGAYEPCVEEKFGTVHALSGLKSDSTLFSANIWHCFIKITSMVYYPWWLLLVESWKKKRKKENL